VDKYWSVAKNIYFKEKINARNITYKREINNKYFAVNQKYVRSGPFT